MIHRFVRKIALALGGLKFVGLSVLIGFSVAQAAITEPGIVSISTQGDEPKFLIPDGSALRVVGEGDASNIEVRFVGEEGSSRVISLHVNGAPTALLNIQSGTLQFSEVSPDWYSAHWLVQETDNGTRLINRWKPAFAIGRAEDGSVTTLSSADDATLWKTSSGSAAPDISDASEIILITDDLSSAANVEMQMNRLDAESGTKLVEAELVEAGVYRFFHQQEGALSVMHIQNGQLELSVIDASWWSGQWVAEPVAGEGAKYLLRNRWRPEILLQRNDDGALTALMVDPSTRTDPKHFWRILELSKIVSEQKALADAAALEALERHRAANQPSGILDAAEKNLSVVEELGGEQNIQPAQVQPEQSAMPSQTEDPGAVVTSKAGVEKQKKRQVAEKLPPKTEKKTETLLDKIHGEISGNNNFTDSVGPFQTYLKLYAHNLLGFNETIWVLGDAFALGRELSAFRTGFDLPATEERDWYVRYAGHFVWLNPTPVDRDFQSLAINEQEHIGEFYRVTQTEGHRNETGIFFNYLNSNQAKLELNATEARDLSFSSRDIGVFTSGNFWRENDATKDNGRYRLSVSKGLNVFGATREFAVRTEARNSPLVVKGHLDARRYWKESRWHIAGAANFQWADRPTEWHKHFGLGGANYAQGFPAAEVAGEIGAGAFFEVGRAFDYQPPVNGLPDSVRLTPYIRGDVAYVDSLFDNLIAPLEYARDGFFASATLGVRVEADKWNFDVGYAVPVSGESRFEDARDGRLSFTASLRW